MLKRTWIWIVLLALLVTGCQGGGGQLPSASAPAPETTTGPSTQAPETAPAEITQTETVATGPATCTAVSANPTPGPTEQSLFPPVGENDWVQGPASAYVTILEYSDFM